MQARKYKLFDPVIISGTATGKGDLIGRISDGDVKVINEKYYYTVRSTDPCFNVYSETFFVAEHHLKKINN